jgi:hypothetical protein
MRLIKDDPNGVDDRDSARYVAHIGVDARNPDGSLAGDIGISRWRMITKDWQPINFLTGGITKAELEANPPPLSLPPG